jgi:Fanconi anemia group M protein
MTWITHPLIRPESLESRAYQLSIAMHALEGNTLVVLPTGLGKTAVALIVAASRLHSPGGKVLVLAPTKPLVEQHLRFFERFLVRHDGSPFPSAMFTGETPPDERSRAWQEGTVICATPQVIKNDLIAGRYNLADVILMVVDECHRAVGNYAYVFLAQRYMTTGKNPLILAMTASPGGKPEKVSDVCANLGIVIVETRSEEDADVSPYVHEREIEVVTVPLPDELGQALADLHALLDSRLDQLRAFHFDVPKRQQLTMKALNGLNAQIQARIQARDPQGYLAASLYAEIMKLRHAIALAGSQGSRVLHRYLEKLRQEGEAPGGSKASRRLAADPVFHRLLDRAGRWQGELHPKPAIIVDIVRQQLDSDPDSRIIIFASYRDAVQLIVDELSARGIPCERFVGQAVKDSDRGLSQKRQIEALSRFRSGTFRVLVATSVGEEGLDVPSTDLVVFYEAVPSEIRSIQRKGRTGRSRSGKIIVLVTKGTADEMYRFVSQNRERAMQSGIRRLSAGNPATVQVSLDTPISRAPEPAGSVVPPGPRITVDDRETSSRVVSLLSDMGASIALDRLMQGDYAIGDRILVERKTSRDFIDTLVERDLFAQLSALSTAAPLPVLIIEGGDIYTERDLHPNAIRGALAAIAADLRIIPLFTRDEEDTAQMLFVLASREAGGARYRRLPQRKPHHAVHAQQEAIIAAFPEIGLKNARLLLRHFGSVQAVVDAEEADLVAVKGIGDRKARKIHELSSRTYRPEGT